MLEILPSPVSYAMRRTRGRSSIEQRARSILLRVGDDESENCLV